MSILERVPSAETPDEKTSDIKRVVFSSIVGTAVEWYDFLIYGTANALVFNKLFFPLSDPSLGTIAAFGTYGVGFLARPFGGAIFGHFGDRVGRKAMLAMTIVIMGLGTFLVGLLPTYSQIGVLDRFSLCSCDCFRASVLAANGPALCSWSSRMRRPGAVLMVVENAPARSRGFLGSMVQLGYPIGNLAAIGALALLSQLPEAAFLAWGWRIPFLISILLAGVGLYIRLQLDETLIFRAIECQEGDIETAVDRGPDRAPPVTAVGLKLSEISYVSIAGVFAISYVTGKLAMPRSVILNAILASAVVALLAIPVFGWLSDRIGRRTMFYASCMFAISFAFPMFWPLNTKIPRPSR